MATLTTAGLNGVQHLPNLGAVPLHPMDDGDIKATPAAGAFKPGLGVKSGMNANMNQAVGGAWSDMTPTVSDPSRWLGNV